MLELNKICHDNSIGFANYNFDLFISTNRVSTVKFGAKNK